MSNPTDSNPDQPQKPEDEKPTGRSSFDFELPPDVGSSSNLPPVPTPEGETTKLLKSALPPRPSSERPSGNSFDFIDLPVVDSTLLSSTRLGDQPSLSPADSAVVPPNLPRPDSDASVVLGPPSDPSSPSLGPTSSVYDIGSLPKPPDGQPLSAATSIPDIATLFPSIPATPDAATGSSGDSFVLPPIPSAQVPDESPSSVMGGNLELPLAEPTSDVYASNAELELPIAEPLSDENFAIPPTDLPSNPPAKPVPTPDLEEVFGEMTPVVPIKPTNAWLDPNKSDPDMKKNDTTSALPRPPRPSSFEFTMSQGDIAPLETPEGDDTGTFQAALPPQPTATERPSNVSFDFINLPPEAGGTGKKPLLTPTSGVIDLPPAEVTPPAQSADDPDAAVGNLELADSVKPASGWLDSGVLASGSQAAEDLITNDSLDMTPATGNESSDIFSGSRAVIALPPIEQSDVLAANGGAKSAFDASKPVEPHRPSDFALGINDPLGGEELLMADEVPDSSSSLLGHRSDIESIHDMPGMAVDPLFDSSKLAETPDLPSSRLPSSRRRDSDMPDYGKAPELSSDASSILAEFNDLQAHPPGTDSSSVRVESPGVDRTLTSGPAEGNFDLTVPEEPIPEDLFGNVEDVTLVEGSDWSLQKDLFAEGRTPDEELPGSGIRPAIPGSRATDPELKTRPESIFLDPLPGPSTGFDGSSNLQIGGPVRPSEVGLTQADVDSADAADFSDHPALKDMVERRKDPAPGKTQRTTPREDPIDWDSATPTESVPRDASDSAILRGLADPTEMPTRERPATPGADDDDSAPSVTVDWMANSAEGPAMAEADAQAEAEAVQRRGRKEQPTKGRPAKPRDDAASAETRVKPTRVVTDAAETVERTAPREKPAKKGGGMFVGLLLGALAASGASAGLYFSGAIPNSEQAAKPTPNPNNGGNKPNPPSVLPQPASDVRSAFAAGDFARALELVKSKPAETIAEKAAAGSVRIYAKVNGTGTDEDLKQGQDDLKAVADDADAAKSPEGLKRAVKATIDLGVSYEASGDTETAKKLFTEAKAKFPSHSHVFDALLDRLNAASGGDAGTSFRLTPAEAERVLLTVGILLQDDAPKTGDDPEPGQFYWKAVRLAREGKYTEAIEQINQAKAAHIKRAKALAGRGLNPLTDPLEQMFPRACDELAASWKLRSELYKNPAIADAIKKDQLEKKLDSLLKAEKDLANAQADLASAKVDVKTANDKAAKLETDVKAIDKDLKVAKKDLKTAQDDLKTANDSIKTAKDDLAATAKVAKEKDDVIASVAAALKPAKLLPEKWTPADVVAGAKTAASFASGIDAERVTKAENALKDLTKKYDTDTKALTTKYDTDTKKLTDDHATEMQKLKDAAADNAKKLTDQFTADTKKLKDDHAVAIKAEQAKTDAEKKNAALKEIAFQKQLGNAVTPSQALDIWLPVLTDLRRESDADPAIAIAKRSLTSSAPDSDDEGKAYTTIGMGQLLKGNYREAKDAFQAARRTAAYKPEKPWAKIADTGLEAITDPLALYRQPAVVPPVDSKAAAKSLDAGISAYRTGKYEVAVTALINAAKNDPSDPIAWYFLGAARWAMGNEEQAKKDFLQGVEREKTSPQPARVLNAALAPLQGNVRDAIDKVRP